ncbi:PEP/pyruvate-binding domain-containing protein [candidate division KSB1 bacterium]
MKWIFKKDRSKQKDLKDDFKNLRLVALQKNYQSFHTLVEEHDNVLKIVSDLEEKSQGEYLFDINYVTLSLDKIRTGTNKIIEMLNTLGDNRYSALQGVFDKIYADIMNVLPGKQRITEGDFTIPLSEINRDSALSVGSKNAHLGELKSKLDLPVPDGYAISTWAYKYFMDSNNLQKVIPEQIYIMDIKNHEELVAVSENIREMIMSSPIPDDLAASIINSYRALKKRHPLRNVALRSSAIGEDTEYSFAGQYISFLNIEEDEILDRYREIIASKFTPKAIYYILSHSISESQLAMGVSCLIMVDAVSSGVVYTRNPINPADDCMLVNAIYGLGKYLVDGTLTPDMFRISRSSFKVQEKHIAGKPVRLVLNKNGGTVEEPVSESEQELPALDEQQLQVLAEIALKLEEHYNCPQDIEWAVDRSGQLFILQTRPLRIVEYKKPQAEPDVSRLEVLLSGGTTVCPGAGSGEVFFARSSDHLPYVPDGAVLVAPQPFPSLVIAMNKINAIVTEVGSAASHMASLAREKNIPTLVGLDNVSKLPVGKEITIDATNGVIYAGSHPELVEALRPEYELFENTGLFNILGQILSHISPLSMFDPTDTDFIPENCKSVHDIIRFVHQKANEEMFGTVMNIEDEDKVAVPLNTDIPLPLKLIYIDENMWKYMGRKSVNEDEIESVPMKAFWSGVKEEGWPSTPQTDLKGFSSVVTTHFVKGGRQEFLESSFAILSREYMLINLRMGYHFSSVRAWCTEDREKNYIYMRYKEGGASYDRRIRRIKLISDLLSMMGFENFSKGDFLDAGIAGQRSDVAQKKLYYLGRISMMTKQLDMALYNDEITQMITEDFILKLGIGHYLG